MGMQHVMLDLPDEMYEEAARLAAQEQTSVTELLRSYIDDAMQKSRSYVSAQREFMVLLDEGLDFRTNGQITWTRDELYDRNG